jgi:uncharacterized protein (TIGR02246 family)
MKHLSIFVGFVCLIAMLLPTCAPAPEPEPEAAPEPVFDPAAEEAAVREATEQWMAAFNKHDAQAMGALLDENLEWWDGTVKGRAAIVERQEEFIKQSPDRHIELTEEVGIVFLTPDVAIHKHYDEITGRLDADGKPLPPRKDLRAFVYVKKNGKWLRAAGFRRVVMEE